MHGSSYRSSRLRSLAALGAAGLVTAAGPVWRSPTLAQDASPMPDVDTGRTGSQRARGGFRFRAAGRVSPGRCRVSAALAGTEAHWPLGAQAP